MNYSGGRVWQIIEQWGAWVQNCSSHGSVFQVEVEIFYMACKITDWVTREEHTVSGFDGIKQVASMWSET